LVIFIFTVFFFSGHFDLGGLSFFLILASFLGNTVSFCLCSLLVSFFSLSTLFSFTTLLLHLCGLLFSVFSLFEFALTLDSSALFVACLAPLIIALLLLGGNFIPLVIGKSLELVFGLELVELLLDGFVVEVVVPADADDLVVADNLDVFAHISLLSVNKFDLIVVKIYDFLIVVGIVVFSGGGGGAG